MPRIIDTQTNLNGGQVGEAVASRNEIDLYKKAVKTAKNAMLRVTGGMTNKPGMNQFAQLDTDAIGTQAFKLVPFHYNDEYKYVVSISNFGSQKMKIYNVDGTACTVTQTAVPSWADADYDNIQWTQLGPVMIFFHKDYRPIVLTRTGATTFTTTNFSFFTDYKGIERSPMLPLRFDQGVNVRRSYTLTGTMTATSSVFTIADVGKFIKFPNGIAKITAFISGTQVTTDMKEGWSDQFIRLTMTTPFTNFLDGETVVQASSGTTYDAATMDIINVASTTITGIKANRIAFNISQNVKGLDSETVVVPSAVNDISGSYNQISWFETVYNDDNGWPACGVFHEGRLWIGGGDPAPYYVFGSKTGEYFNFDTGKAEANDGIAISLINDQVSELIHLYSHDSLMAFTDGGMSLAPSTDDQPLTPTTIRFVPQDQYGTAKHIRPMFLDNAVITVQDNNKTVRETLYEFQTQKSLSKAVSLTADNLLTNITHATVLKSLEDRNEQYAFLLNDDNTVAAFHSIRDENTRGWTQWTYTLDSSDTFDRDILDICAVDDELFTLARVDVGAAGTDCGYILYKMDFDNPLDFRIPLSYNAAYSIYDLNRIYLDISTSTDFGLTAGATFYNKRAWVIAIDPSDSKNIIYLGEYEFGATRRILVNLPDTPYKTWDFYAGIFAQPEIVPLPISKVFTDGNVLADVKRTSSVSLDVLDTLNMTVDDQSLNPGYVIGGDLATKFTGLRKFYTLGWDYNNDTVISTEIPCPFHLRSIIREVEI